MSPFKLFSHQHCIMKVYNVMVSVDFLPQRKNLLKQRQRHVMEAAHLETRKNHSGSIVVPETGAFHQRNGVMEQKIARMGLMRQYVKCVQISKNADVTIPLPTTQLAIALCFPGMFVS